VTCRSCGTAIADKAIICYRCGAPTATEPTTAPSSRSARTPPVRPIAARLVAAAVGAVAAVYAGTPVTRWGWTGIALALTVWAGVDLWRRRAGRRA